MSFQATGLRALVKQMLPCAESKNVSESNYTVLSIQQVMEQNQDGTQTLQNLLVATTQQPTFGMEIAMRLNSDEVTVDRTAILVCTRDLDNALATFGQRCVEMELLPTGDISIQSVEKSGQTDDAPGRRVRVRGEVADFCPLASDLRSQQPKPDAVTVVLPDCVQLVEGLQSAVSIAAQRGNGVRQSGVRLLLDVDQMVIEAVSPSVCVSNRYDAPYQQAPAHASEHLLSPDSVRHLCAALKAYGVGSEVVLVHDEDSLSVMCDRIVMEVD